MPNIEQIKTEFKSLIKKLLSVVNDIFNTIVENTKRVEFLTKRISSFNHLKHFLLEPNKNLLL